MKRQKRAITLLEIMIVVLLIGIIGSVLGYNMKGSLDEGKAFKSREGAKQVRDILLLQNGGDVPLQTLVDERHYYLENSGLVNNVDNLLKDGWGEPFEVKVSEDHETIEVTSQRLLAYEARKKAKP